MEPDSTYALQEFFGDKRQELIAHIPQARELGFQVLEAGPEGAKIRLPIADHLVGDAKRGVVFGGVITTLLDQLAGVAVLCKMKEFTSLATIDLRIDYMRPATPGRDLIGSAECYRMTKSVAFVRGAAYHDDPQDSFANFVATFMLAANAAPPMGGPKDGENRG